MNQPVVSIIIPCYNQAIYLEKAIGSLQAQTLEAWECIIVDDGSTDNSLEIAARMALHDARIRVMQKLNGGSASARNMGLDHAQGEYIQFLDADDSIDEYKLERQVSLMRSRQSDISYTAYCYTYADGSRSAARYALLDATRIITHWGLDGSIPPHAFLYKASFLKTNQLVFDEACRYREDWNWLIECFRHKPQISALPDYCGAMYFQNQNGKTGSYIKMQRGNFLFMAYKAPSMHGLNRLLWAYRISEELWIWILRMIKYRSTDIAKSILLLPNTWTIAALLLMPISIWSIIVYFIKTYIAK